MYALIVKYKPTDVVYSKQIDGFDTKDEALSFYESLKKKYNEISLVKLKEVTYCNGIIKPKIEDF